MSIRLLFAAVVCFVCSYSSAADKVYHGDWKTTNRKLDGQMTCIVTEKGKEQWEGRFYGIWQGVDFDYTVPFTGPLDELQGKATIDGVAYEWKARIDGERFRANFGGDLYRGSFDLKATTQAKPAPVTKGSAAKTAAPKATATKERRKGESK
jgi:hypothetical protein